MARDCARQVAVAALAILWASASARRTSRRRRSDLRSITYRSPCACSTRAASLCTDSPQSDFQVFEDGQAQTVAAFSAVDIPSKQVDATVPDAPLAALDAVASNDPVEVDGRVYVFVLDNQFMHPDIALRTRHVVRGFIRDYVKTNDIAAVVFTGAGRGQHFTRNRRLLDDAIGRLLGDPDPTDDAARRSMATIADTARSMVAIKGRRKALVLLSSSPICLLSEMDSTSTCRDDASTRFATRCSRM